jgi:Regulator of chromosome condensation (RCC1) repeat
MPTNHGWHRAAPSVTLRGVCGMVNSRGATSCPVLAVLVLLGAWVVGGCERDFSFLDDRMPGDARPADASHQAEVGRPDTSIALPKDAESNDAAARDALAPIGERDALPPIDASDGSAADASEAGPRTILTHQIALQEDYMCVIDPASGDVLCRGDGAGDEPDAEAKRDSSTSEWHPVTVSLDGTRLWGARTLAVGRSFGCAIAASDVVCWGSDPGTMQYFAAAHTVLTGAGQYFETLQAGESHVCVADPVYCWGDNTYSQITDVSQMDAAVIREPMFLPDLAYKRLLTLGVRHTCINDADRTLCWGLDDFRQCGGMPDHLCLPTAPCAIQPREVILISGALGLGLGMSHSCAIKADRTVACWGASDKGQVGAVGSTDCGMNACIVDHADILNLNGATRLALGAAHSCALTADGFVYCWGSNEAGQLGVNGIGGSRTDPLQVLKNDLSPLEDVVDLAASGTFTCALTSSGKLYCWGRWMKNPVLTTATEVPLDL